MLDFILTHRKKVLLFSIVFTFFSFTFTFYKGVSAGIDFAGGIKLEYAIEDTSNNVVLEEVKKSIVSSTVIFTEDTIMIKATKGLYSDEKIKNAIETILSKHFKSFKLVSFDKISPKFGDELKERAIISLFLSFLAILLYILYRYEITFSFSAILTLVHDVALTLLFLSIFGIEFNTSTIAAILTLIGYSLNDTIILFDRIRSSIIYSNNQNLSEIINIGITKNFRRMILTSLTTLFSVSALLIFGGEDLYSFSITLFVGIIIGTYSSIFISSTLLEIFKLNILKYRLSIQEKNKRAKEKEDLRRQFEDIGTSF